MSDPPVSSAAGAVDPARETTPAEGGIQILARSISASMEATLAASMDGFLARLDACLAPPTMGTTTPPGAPSSERAPLTTPGTVHSTPGSIPPAMAITSASLIRLAANLEASATTVFTPAIVGASGVCGSRGPDTLADPTRKPAVVVGPNAVLVPQSLVSKIRNNELAELAKDSRDKMGYREAKEEKKISSILQWVECFNSYVAILNQPEWVPDLLAYSSLIVHVARKFQGEGWMYYDRSIRKRTAAGANEKWGEINTSLWALAFSNAQPQEHCALCFSLDHSTKECEDYDKPSTSHEPVPVSEDPHPSGVAPICLKWNWSFCQSGSCRYRHNVCICVQCHGAHKAKECQRRGKGRVNPYQARGGQEKGKRNSLFRGEQPP